MIPAGPVNSEAPSGYLEILRGNRSFRRLWLGQVVSQLGDWFDTIAVYTLILQLTQSAEAAGWLTLARFLPPFFIGPAAGVLVDRLDRRRLLIATDLLRAVVVLGFLLVKSPDRVWLAYLITALQFVISAFFEPARSSLLPSLTSRRELVTANAISSVTWSAMLTLGSAVGGAVTSLAGLDAAFVIDSLTFVVSALFLLGVRVPTAAKPSRGEFTWERATGLLDLREGWRYLTGHHAVLSVLFIKPAWCLASGGLVLLLTLMGDRIFRIGGDASAGMSVLYTARGIGTAIGPVFTRRIAGSDPARMRKALPPAFLVAGTFALLLSGAPNLWFAALATLCAHMGGSVLWVFSTVLLQQAVPNEYRGRVFAAELMAFTLSLSLSTYLCSAAIDRLGIGIRPMMATLALLSLVFAGAWRLWGGITPPAPSHPPHRTDEPTSRSD